MAWYRPMMPRYRNSRINSVVRLGSQSHQVPHIGLPQIYPVPRVISVKPAPILAHALASISLLFILPTCPLSASPSLIPTPPLLFPPLSFVISSFLFFFFPFFFFFFFF